MGQQHARLDEQLCFALYTASREVSNAYRQMLGGIGLTYPQYLVMLALWEQDGRTVGDLCEATRLESNTISPMLRRMESLGVISRRRSADDERVVRVVLTEAGRGLEGAAAQVRKVVEASTGLSDQQFATLRRRLHQIRDRLEAAQLAG